MTETSSKKDNPGRPPGEIPAQEPEDVLNSTTSIPPKTITDQCSDAVVPNPKYEACIAGALLMGDLVKASIRAGAGITPELIDGLLQQIKER
jgi:hypothetical protein